MDAVKTEYPHLIECLEDKVDEDLPLPPPSPDTIDKENVAMTEILPHIFVGTYFFLEGKKTRVLLLFD